MFYLSGATLYGMRVLLLIYLFFSDMHEQYKTLG